jgi:hypothetical protein
MASSALATRFERTWRKCRGRIGTARLLQCTNESGASLCDRGQDFAFLCRESLDGVDQIRNQIGTPLQLRIDVLLGMRGLFVVRLDRVVAAGIHAERQREGHRE